MPELVSGRFLVSKSVEFVGELQQTKPDHFEHIVIRFFRKMHCQNCLKSYLESSSWNANLMSKFCCLHIFVGKAETRLEKTWFKGLYTCARWEVLRLLHGRFLQDVEVGHLRTKGPLKTPQLHVRVFKYFHPRNQNRYPKCWEKSKWTIDKSAPRNSWMCIWWPNSKITYLTNIKLSDFSV